MLYANFNNDKILATPGANGICPSCGEPLRPKCGSIIIWHWAHVGDSGCTLAHEPETPWHLWWKSKFPKEWVEVPVGNHRADVKTPSGIVIEFQHSGISSNQIEEREREYGKMLWVLDARDAYFNHQVEVMRSDYYLHIRTSRWRKAVKDFNRPVFLDIDGPWNMLHIRDFIQRKQTKAERFLGIEQLNWGYGGNYEDFIKTLNQGVRFPPWMATTKIKM